MAGSDDEDSSLKIELETPFVKAPVQPPPKKDSPTPPSRGPTQPLPPIQAHTPLQEEAEPASFLVRTAAYFVDSLICIASSALVADARPAHTWFLFVVYTAGLHASTYQATFGKMLFGLRVEHESGARLSNGRSFARSLGYFLSGMLFMFGFLMAAFTDRRRAMHDFVANSRVVTTRESSPALAVVTVLLSIFISFKVPFISQRLALGTSTRSISTAGVIVDTCIGKKYCVITYVTPWCPACKVSEPTMLRVAQYLKHSKKVGYKIIIGQDNLPNLQQAAAALGEAAMIDESDAIRKQLKIQSFPKWLVWDGTTRKVIHSPDSFQANGELSDAFMAELVSKTLRIPASEVF